MVNIQLIGLTDDQYIELKRELLASKEESWKGFFLKVVKEWKTKQ